MSTATREALWAKLKDGGVVDGATPEAGDASAPWFVRVMLGIAGWIGALFLLGFIGAGCAFLLKSSGAAFAVGVGACAAAVAIFRAAPKNDFVAQFGLAVSLAGQVLMVFGASEWFDRSASGIALYLAVQQALLFVVVPNFVHRLWTSWSGALAVVYVLVEAGLFGFTPAVTTAAFAAVALYEFKGARQGALVRAAVYGLALAAVQTAVLQGDLLGEWIFDHGRHGVALGGTGVWLARIASLGVWVGALAMLLRRENVALSSRPGHLGLLGALILGLIAIKAPGIGPATVILLLGYANADRVLVGLGIFAQLGSLSHYYYSLHTTLLEKSGWLVATGIGLLVARLALRRWWPDDQNKNTEASHA